MILSYNSYTDTLEKQKEKEERLELIERQVSLLMESQKRYAGIAKTSRKINEILI
jgi:hypothetical protein